MDKWTRRDFLKSSVAATAGDRALPLGSMAARGAHSGAAGPSTSPDAAPSTRERLLLDFGWRFHLGHADDPARDFGTLKTALDDGVAQLGRLDIVSANAGIFSFGTLEELDDSTWQDMIDVNLTGVWHTATSTWTGRWSS